MGYNHNDLVGFSQKINHPALAKYVKDTNRWSGIFSLILAFAAVAGFFIAGETSSDMENPEALYIGLGIGSMFLLIAFFQIAGRNNSTTWDGKIVDKKIENKRRRSKDDESWIDYTRYTVCIRSDKGKIHTTTAEDDDTKYNYYKIGDRVRHHKGLNTYEKENKSGDTIIFCNACASLNDINENFCFRCKCPLLK
ncbi:MAG: hypothetical protein GZ094_04150 [Mariniphaga sp.]|nr:hypothetical protein [Mariniphaga sp.]